MSDTLFERTHVEKLTSPWVTLGRVYHSAGEESLTIGMAGSPVAVLLIQYEGKSSVSFETGELKTSLMLDKKNVAHVQGSGTLRCHSETAVARIEVHIHSERTKKYSPLRIVPQNAFTSAISATVNSLMNGSSQLEGTQGLHLGLALEQMREAAFDVNGLATSPRARLDDILSIMRTHAANPRFKVSDIAHLTGYSDRYIRLLFDGASTPNSVLRGIRVTIAQSLLRQGREDIEAIALASGFNSVRAMKRAFSCQGRPDVFRL